ncbi:MAG: methyltransferase domain-containing protein [Candidatus Eisenbacteria bacterium]|nr:methyltransferase domain-containing protein [Candidatus Eisenbacteria bacterium]
MRVPRSLEEIDWNEMFRRGMTASAFLRKSAEEWSDRAASMADRWSPESDYVRLFIDRMSLNGCASLLDVGCGTGDLLLALSPRLEHLYGIDFSPGMLAAAEKKIEERGATNIRLQRLSWTDDWSPLPIVDIVVASRSFSVDDARDALSRMDRQARRRVYLTCRAGGSYLDDSVLTALGRKAAPRPDYILLVNILYALGIQASVDFIEGATAAVVCASLADLVRRVEWGLGRIDEREKNLLARFYEGLPRTEKGALLPGGSQRWARIGWEK